MKYSLSYYKYSRHLDTIDELIIPYTKLSLEIINWIAKRPLNQRVVLDLTKGFSHQNDDGLDYAEIFAAAAEIHPKLAIRVLVNQLDVNKFKEKNLDYFYLKYTSTMDEVNSMLKSGVSDIYITNNLGFNIVAISEWIKSNNPKINIRMLPNVAQANDTMDNLPQLTKFFIRPEDIPLYEGYVDYMEFFGEPGRLNYCYDIYKNGHWHGLLKDIIIGCENLDCNSENLTNVFGQKRLFCQKKCSYSNRCKTCFIIEKLSKKIADRGLHAEIKSAQPQEISEEDLEFIKKMLEEKENDNERKIDEKDLQYEPTAVEDDIS